MKRKGFLKALLAGTVTLALSGCGASEIAFSDAEAAKEALNTAGTIYLESNVRKVMQEADILADDQVAAYMQEKGIIDNKWIVSIEGKTWFYVKYVTDHPINDVEGINSGATYGYYDEEDTCLGYAQKRLLDDGVNGRDYYMVYLDAEGNPKEYYSDEYGYYTYDYEGNLLASGTAEAAGFLNVHDCHVQITMEEGCGTPIDFMDKMAMYIGLFKEYGQWYTP